MRVGIEASTASINARTAFSLLLLGRTPDLALLGQRDADLLTE